ncbi:MAG: carboxy terminal-processing peptidase, partial [Psychroserpens sp.]|nr:carboxy terminal-processing peptidase [Psychroserpens sp.]
FAAAMQDYNRAVIVGTPTYGKASAQGIIPLSDTAELGFSKLTIEKFYRITGQSHQSMGVIPDVQLPNLYDNFKTEEKFSAYALQNDSVQPVLAFSPLKVLPVQELQNSSQQRVKNNESFQAIKGLNQLIIDNYIELETNYTLTLDNVYKSMNDYKTEWEAFSTKLYFENNTLKVSNTDSTDEILSYSENRKAVNDAFIDDIKSDIYIDEAHNIMKDLLRINTNN